MTKGGVKDLLPQSRKSRNINPATEIHPLHHSWIAIIITLNLKAMKLLMRDIKLNITKMIDMTCGCGVQQKAQWHTIRLRN